MIRTQIQLPDVLYREVKRIAREREMSLAEVLRRGAEQMVAQYPAVGESRPRWTPPAPRDLGWRGLSSEEVRDEARGDGPRRRRA